MPSSKFISPENLGTVKANENFTIEMAISNLETGKFVNPDASYFAAPQQLNSQNLIIGHSHFVIQPMSSFQDPKPLDPKKFAFFTAANTPAVNGVLSATVKGGLPVGNYKLSSINTAANHQPVLVPIAQHGSLDDAIYVSRNVIFDNTGWRLYSFLLLLMAKLIPRQQSINRKTQSLLLRKLFNQLPPLFQPLLIRRHINDGELRTVQLESGSHFAQIFFCFW